MKAIVLMISMIVLLSSCAPRMSKPHRKVVRDVRKDLRIKYHYHQTKLGRIINFNKF